MNYKVLPPGRENTSFSEARAGPGDHSLCSSGFLTQDDGLEHSWRPSGECSGLLPTSCSLAVTLLQLLGSGGFLGDLRGDTGLFPGGHSGQSNGAMSGYPHLFSSAISLSDVWYIKTIVSCFYLVFSCFMWEKVWPLRC